MKNITFLIGAARSGTKLVRDVLGSHQQISVVPYDINFIWKRGLKLEHDEIEPFDYSDKMINRIRRYLERYRNENPILVEKSVSNTLRVPTLYKHFPEAKFVFLYRNGLDVCESVIRQWEGQVSNSYLLEKIKHVPIPVLFTYGINYFVRMVRKGSKQYFWGVEYAGMKEDLQRRGIHEIVAKQWQRGIEHMLLAKNIVPPNQLIEVRYETIVKAPRDEFTKILDFLGSDLQVDDLNLTQIKSEYVGRSNNLVAEQKADILKMIEGNMKLLNYL